MAPKPIEINAEVVAAMAFAGANDTDIAWYVGVSPRTLVRRCAAILEKERAGRRYKLRQMQWKAAESGNITMLIFLGKQDLGQADRVEFGLTPADLEKMSDDQLRAVAAGHPPLRVVQGGMRTSA